jgi:hypothetical protein
MDIEEEYGKLVMELMSTKIPWSWIIIISFFIALGLCLLYSYCGKVISSKGQSYSMQEPEKNPKF